MKAMKLTGIRQMKMTEVPDPVIRKDTDVLIRMRTVGVCGSDIHYYTTGRIGSQVVQYPFTVGHEGAGEVMAVGSAVRSLKPGDRIAIEPAMPCHACDQCLAGRPHTCRQLKFLGCPGQAEGCLSEYLVMPETSCFRIADSLSFDEATLMEPLAIGVYANDLAGDLANKDIAILGAGPIGISVLLYALHRKVRSAFVSDIIDARTEKAVQFGAHMTGNPEKEDLIEKVQQKHPGLLDVVFECCGKQEAMDQAVELLKPGGKLMIIGIPEFDRWSLSADELRRREICIQNVRRQNHSLEKTHSLIAEKKIGISAMATHHFDFSRTKEAFDLVAQYGDGVMKTMIRINS